MAITVSLKMAMCGFMLGARSYIKIINTKKFIFGKSVTKLQLYFRSLSDGNLVRAPSERFLLSNINPR